MFRRLIANPLVRYYRDLALSLRSAQVHRTARVGPGAVLKGAIVDERASVGQDSMLYWTRLGRYSYISHGSRIANCEIGSFCSIGPNVVVAPGRHPVARLSTHPIFYSPEGQVPDIWVTSPAYRENGRVKIGSDVWIGMNSVILDDVKIGDGAVIAAGSVVVGDVEPYSIVGGIPARHLRFRFSEDVRGILLGSKWWDLPVSTLRRYLPLFQQDPLEVSPLLMELVALAESPD